MNCNDKQRPTQWWRTEQNTFEDVGHCVLGLFWQNRAEGGNKLRRAKINDQLPQTITAETDTFNNTSFPHTDRKRLHVSTQQRMLFRQSTSSFTSQLVCLFVSVGVYFMEACQQITDVKQPLVNCVNGQMVKKVKLIVTPCFALQHQLSMNSHTYLSWQFSISLERFVRWVLRPTTPSSLSNRNNTPLNLDRSLRNIWSPKTCVNKPNMLQFSLLVRILQVYVRVHPHLSRVQLTDVLLTSHR